MKYSNTQSISLSNVIQYGLPNNSKVVTNDDNIAYEELGYREIFSEEDDELNNFIGTVQDIKGSNRLGQVIVMTLENIDNACSVVQSVLDENNLDISNDTLYSRALENKISPLFDRMKDILIQSMKKLMTAIMKFVKTIQNTIKSEMITGQSRWFAKNRDSVIKGFDKIETMTVGGGNDREITISTVFHHHSTQAFSDIAKTVYRCFEEFHQYIDLQLKEIIEGATNYIEDTSPTDSTFSLIWNKITTIKIANSALKDNSVVKNIFLLPGKSRVNEIDLDPIEAANKLIFPFNWSRERPKPEERTIASFIQDSKEFDNLSINAAKPVESIAKSIKMLSSNFSKDLKFSQNNADRIVRTAIAVQKQSKQIDPRVDKIIQLSKEVHKKLNEIRTIRSTSLYLAISVYTEYLNYRSDLYKVAQICAQLVQ